MANRRADTWLARYRWLIPTVGAGARGGVGRTLWNPIIPTRSGTI